MRPLPGGGWSRGGPWQLVVTLLPYLSPVAPEALSTLADGVTLRARTPRPDCWAALAGWTERPRWGNPYALVPICLVDFFTLCRTWITWGQGVTYGTVGDGRSGLPDRHC